jgi:hypothetical protein
MTTTTIAASSKNGNDRLHQIRIVIADDHPVVRIGVKNMLQSDPDLEVIGEASDGDEAITATLELLPDILLLFAQFPVPRVHANAIFRVSVNGGRPEQVPTTATFDEFDCPVSNRGTCVLRGTIGNQFVYYALDPLQGKGRELGRTDWLPNVLGDWGLSPDSSMVALANHDPARPFIRIVTLSSAAQATTLDIPVPGHGTILKPTWSTDARGFYVESKTEIGYSLLYVDLAGHVKVLRDTPNPIWGVPTRDGTKLAFVDQSAGRNVWIGRASTP